MSYHNLEGRPSLTSCTSAYIVVKTHKIARYESNVILGYSESACFHFHCVFLEMPYVHNKTRMTACIYSP